MIIRPERSLLVVSNMQEGILPAMDAEPSFLWNTCWLAALAGKLGIPALVMEHKRLGDTVREVRELTSGAPYVEVVTLSFFDTPASREKIRSFGRDQLIFCGNETHISIVQSALGAKEDGLHPFVVGEACAARDRADHEAAIARLQVNAVDVVTREMIFFEWFRSSEDSRYRETSIEFLKHPHPFPLPEHRVQ